MPYRARECPRVHARAPLVVLPDWATWNWNQLDELFVDAPEDLLHKYELEFMDLDDPENGRHALFLAGLEGACHDLWNALRNGDSKARFTAANGNEVDRDASGGNEEPGEE